MQVCQVSASSSTISEKKNFEYFSKIYPLCRPVNQSNQAIWTKGVNQSNQAIWTKGAKKMDEY